MKAATKFKVFCIRYFSKNEAQTSEKNNKTVYISKTKSTCQNSTTSENFQKWPKNQGIVLALSLSVVILLRLCSPSRRNLFNYNQPFTPKSNWHQTSPYNSTHESYIHPLTPMSDQDRISPYNINTTSSR